MGFYLQHTCNTCHCCEPQTDSTKYQLFYIRFCCCWGRDPLGVYVSALEAICPQNNPSTLSLCNTQNTNITNQNKPPISVYQYIWIYYIRCTVLNDNTHAMNKIIFELNLLYLSKHKANRETPTYTHIHHTHRILMFGMRFLERIQSVSIFVVCRLNYLKTIYTCEIYNFVENWINAGARHLVPVVIYILFALISQYRTSIHCTHIP